MQRHGAKLTKKSRTHEVTRGAGRGEFVVTSGTSGKSYTVTELTDGRFACVCKWAEYHPCGECSHVIAVREWLANAEGRHVHAHDSLEAARKSHHKIEDRNDGLWYTTRKARA